MRRPLLRHGRTLVFRDAGPRLVTSWMMGSANPTLSGPTAVMTISCVYLSRKIPLEHEGGMLRSFG